MRAAALFLLLVPSTAFADRLVLKEGQVIEGRIISEGEQVVLQIDGGKISFARTELRAIERDDQSALAQFGKRRSALDAGDIKGRLALARWAKDQGLTAAADGLYGEVLELDANQNEARLALGHVKLDGKWLTPDENLRARGMVRYGGRWVSAEEAAAAAANLRTRSERRREQAEVPAPAERHPSRVDEIAWGNDQWIDGKPPLADWIYPAYGYPRSYGANWGTSSPRAGLNVTITGRGSALAPAPRNLLGVTPAPVRGSSGARPANR